MSLPSAAAWSPKENSYAAFGQPGATGARRVLLIGCNGVVVLPGVCSRADQAPVSTALRLLFRVARAPPCRVLSTWLQS